MAYEAHVDGVTSEASEGCVVIEGQGIAATLAPNLALDLADQLTSAAVDAMGHRRMAEINEHARDGLVQESKLDPSPSG